MKVVLLGCGLVGRKRAEALGAHTLVGCADPIPERAAMLAARHPGCRAFSDWQQALAETEADLAVVATPHDALPQVAAAAVSAGLHVLLEKPGARSGGELAPLAALAAEHRVRVHLGYNHRFHPALRQAHALAMAGRIGALTHVRASYGHGGRPGYETEWRGRRESAGGGELIDQGAHLIDLSAWFLGPFSAASGVLRQSFWASEVEDNAFVLLETAGGQVAQLHASWTEWKNRFSFEIFGRTGKLEVTGLGGSYDPERLTLYTMRPELGPPDTEHWTFEGADQSWHDEFSSFTAAIAEGRPPAVGLADGQAVLDVIDRIYAAQVRP